MEQVADLVLTPFREIVDRGRTAAENAASEFPEMAKAATNLAREGERALKRIEPQCQHHLEEFGSSFLDALKDNAADEIAAFRTELNDLLWEFDDYLDPADFDPTKYTQLQQASRKAAPRIHDILVRMRLDPPVPSALSVYAGSSDTASLMTSRRGTMLSDALDRAFPHVPSIDGDVRQQFLAVQQHRQSPVSVIESYAAGIHQPRPQQLLNGLNVMTQSPGPVYGDQLSPPPTSPLPEPPRPPSANPWDINIKPGPFTSSAPRASGIDFTEAQQLQLQPQRIDSISNMPPRTRARTLSTDSAAYAPSIDESPVLGASMPVQLSMTTARARVPPSTIPEHAPLNADYSAPSVHRRSSVSTANLRVSQQRSVESLRSNNNSEHRGSVFSNSESHAGTVGTSAASSPGRPQNARVHSGVPLAVPEEPLQPTLHSDDGLIVVDVEEEHERQRPINVTNTNAYKAPALKPALITSNASFHVYKGFCKGASDVMRGDIGVTSVRKQTFNGSHTVARCSHCMFELDYKELEYDLNKDDRGNFTIAGMGFRLRMLQKSHVATRRNDEQFYACLICVNLGQTVEESDATVFFTQQSLFNHLARHPRPLPPIDGLTIIQEPTIPDAFKNNYDLHVKGPQTVSLTAEKAEQIANMPSAVCRGTIKKLYGMRLLNDQTPAFEMAEGARIVGIEFPERYEGEWCMGFHDGAYASFPFDTVRLVMPPAEHIRRHTGAAGGGARATARWKFAPKQHKAAGKGGGTTDWLKFDRGDTITQIAWVARGHWCWSGVNAKGKWGIFPASHVDAASVVEAAEAAEAETDRVSVASSGRTEGGGGGFLARLTAKKREKAPAMPRHW
ncbi:hypothetical protein TD95_002485 [Thielaviopsis punctulata]|uniref:SH3 domain-containing protein n=1 Tax=Thielaviopsis punctulata TaxID=72032 RepID=A0A0F4ZFC9_9PEZI|nr:hypothetical protein TD95_002485 [Thielaviopsis punctulata]